MARAHKIMNKSKIQILYAPFLIHAFYPVHLQFIHHVSLFLLANISLELHCLMFSQAVLFLYDHVTDSKIYCSWLRQLIPEKKISCFVI